MITRTHRAVEFVCDSPGCGEDEILQPVPRLTDEDIWLHKNGWKREGRFLFCPCCVAARAAIRRAA